MTQNKLLNKYLEATKKPFEDVGSMYDVDIAEECEKISDDFVVGFVDWLIKRETKYFESLNELLEIYKKTL